MQALSMCASLSFSYVLQQIGSLVHLPTISIYSQGTSFS